MVSLDNLTTVSPRLGQKICPPPIMIYLSGACERVIPYVKKEGVAYNASIIYPFPVEFMH
jgi:hypothetical protein